MPAPAPVLGTCASAQATRSARSTPPAPLLIRAIRIEAKAEYNAGTAQTFAEIGYGFAVQSLAIEPFANLAWVNLRTDDINETGASAGLAGPSASSNVGYTSLGIRAATSMAVGEGMTLQPHASLAWQSAFGDVAPSASLGFISAPGASFEIAGVPLAENTALVEIGADMIVSPRTRIGLSYMGQFAERRQPECGPSKPRLAVLNRINGVLGDSSPKKSQSQDDERLEIFATPFACG